MDKITISNLEVFSYHGVLREENTLGQKFIVSAALFLNTREAGKSDDISKSVNYALVCSCIKKYMQKNTVQLIETVAEDLAKKILLDFTLIKKVKIEIKKPWAAVYSHLDYVAVEIERSWHEVYLSIGSNMGDKRKYLDDSIHAINSNELCHMEKISKFITTKPVGDIAQDDFLNGCVKFHTLYTPHELLDFLHEIESDLGRERTVRWGPRTIDLDILYYDDIILYDEILTIPHREMINREFVLIPLLEIAPYKIHPIYQKTTEQFLQSKI